MNLRPYQAELITDIRLQYQLGHRKVLAVLPTGAGKTVCFSHIAQAAAKKGNRVLIAVHRQELLDQACRALPMPHGVIAANRAMDLSAAVQVASVQTLARRLHKLPRDFFQLVIIDEAHHSNAGTWAKVLEHFHQAHLLGVTATPIRLDGRGLGEHYQAMVEGPSAAWLTDNGYLAPARVLAPPGFDTTGLRKRMGDFDTKEAEHRIGTIMGDCLSHYRKHLDGQTAIAFCCSVAHAEAVARLFMGAGIPAASIDGSMTSEQRRDLLQALGTGRIRILTSCALIGEGVDVPSVGGCILLRPTASTSLHLQMIGRCLRPSPGKAAAVVLDHVGNTLRLGHHLEPREWTLEGLAKRDRDKAPSVKVCPQCFAAMASQAKQCGECGHTFAAEVRELQQVEGELVSYSKFIRWKIDKDSEIDGAWQLVAIAARAMANGHLAKGDKMPSLREMSIKAGLHRNTIMKAYCKMQHLEIIESSAGSGYFVMSKDAADLDRICWAITAPLGAAPLDILHPDQQKNKAQTLDDLRQLAQQRGYQRGWAERVYQARLAKRYGM
jgi:superfamily II DNA or RNA helicase